MTVSTKLEVVSVSAPGPDADAARDLFLEYGESLGFNTCFGGFEQELMSLPGDYAPPPGCLLLAKEGLEVAGCVGVKPLDDARCEMKRLYVRPQFRRTRVGRLLAQTAIERARSAGYLAMYLDTLPTMIEARALYAALGFKPCAPYYDNACVASDCFELLLTGVTRDW